MAKFWLIQRGKFTTQKPSSALCIDSNIDYDYMGSAEFEWGAIPKAFRRMMYNFDKYSICQTGICSPEGEQLVIVCKSKQTAEIVRMLKEFIEHPYSLKEYSELEKIPTAKKDDTSFERRSTNFWWCIDHNEYGDWMACMSSESAKLFEILTHDYENWWLKKSLEEREEEYRKSTY